MFLFFLTEGFRLLNVLYLDMKKKVLIVEKDKDILQIISHILSSEGYEVSTSQTERGVLERIEKEKPEVVLLDIVKPTLEGTELCRALKSFENISVIVLSTHMNIESFLNVCADDIISKPFDISELIDTIEKFTNDC